MVATHAQENPYAASVTLTTEAGAFGGIPSGAPGRPQASACSQEPPVRAALRQPCAGLQLFQFGRPASVLPSNRRAELWNCPQHQRTGPHLHRD